MMRIVDRNVERHFPVPSRFLMYFTRSVISLLLLLALVRTPVFAQGNARPPVQLTAVHGALLTPAKAETWASLTPKTGVPADQLLVALFGAEFRSLNGAVEARMVADVGQRGPFPVLEAALQFHANAKKDLDVTLERGILVLINTRKAGPAQVRLRVSEETFEVELHEPKATLGVEVYGRHVRGTPKLTNKKDDVPVLNAAFFALQGDVIINTEKQATRLQAPPGAALYMWDNVTRMPDVHRFESLPDSVKPMTAEERKKFDTISGFAKNWTSKPASLGNALEAAARSKEASERKAAVVALGALDELPRLTQVLSNEEYADTRDMAILVIRHWLGRAPGQSIRMFQHLTKNEGYTPNQAKNLLHLFNGIEEEQLRQPETFDLLIGALNHPKMPARELARWHLVRLVPEGKAIAYDAAAPEPMRLKAIAEWRRLIPEGELPALKNK